MSGSGLGLQTSEEVGNSRKRKHEINGDEDAASVSTNFSGNSDCYAGWSPQDVLREITRLKAELYDRDVRIKKLKKKKSAWVKEKGLLEKLCHKQATSLEKHMNASVINLNETRISKLESCKTSDKIAAFGEVGQDALRHREIALPGDGANNVQFAAPADTEQAEKAAKAAQEEMCTALTNEKAALQAELANVRADLAAASALIETHGMQTEEMRAQHEAALAHATFAAKEAHRAAVQSDREQIAKLQALLLEQQTTSAWLLDQRADTAAEVARLQDALTERRACTSDSVCQAAGAVSSARQSWAPEEQRCSLPVQSTGGDKDLCAGMATLRGQLTNGDERQQHNQGLSTSLSPDITQFEGSTDIVTGIDADTAQPVLRENFVRIQHMLVEKMCAVNNLLREKAEIAAELAASRVENCSVVSRCTDTVRRHREAEQGMVRTLEIERASHTTQLNSVLLQIAALQLEVQGRDVQIRGLLDNFRARTAPSGAVICDGSLPPLYSAQLADLQAQVWELRAEVQSRTARVTELEQQCTLNSTERALYEKLRLAFAKQGAELQGVLQQRQGYARIVGAAVTALKSEYPVVFELCAEIARERYPHAQGAAADYYTLAVYGYRARTPSCADPQGDVNLSLGTSDGADAAHNTASSDDTHTLPSGDLLCDASRAHYSRESGLAVPSTVTSATMVDLTDQEIVSDDPQMLLESKNGLSAHGP